ncbi:hypothetical protein V2J09_004341 [Rumex salicifolius]
MPPKFARPTPNTHLDEFSRRFDFLKTSNTCCNLQVLEGFIEEGVHQSVPSPTSRHFIPFPSSHVARSPPPFAACWCCSITSSTPLSSVPLDLHLYTSLGYWEIDRV